MLVEADRLGGTCLNRGCIPSKALIHVAAEFEAMARAAGEGRRSASRSAAPPTLDMAETVRWKDGIVDKLNSGVAALLKRAKVQVVEGWATFADAKTCTVETADGHGHHHRRARDPGQRLRRRSSCRSCRSAAR